MWTRLQCPHFANEKSETELVSSFSSTPAGKQNQNLKPGLQVPKSTYLNTILYSFLFHLFINNNNKTNFKIYFLYYGKETCLKPSFFLVSNPNPNKWGHASQTKAETFVKFGASSLIKLADSWMHNIRIQRKKKDTDTLIPSGQRAIVWKPICVEKIES